MADRRAHGASTIITGHANAPLCNADRLWLQSYIYAEGDAPKADYVPKQFAQAVYAVPKHWEKTAEVNDRNGLRAQLWEPKDRSKDHVAICEPTLIYRGSRMVMTDVAFYFRVDALHTHWDLVVVPEGKGSDVAQSGSPKLVGVDEGGNPNYVDAPATDGSHSGVGVFGVATDASEVRDRLASARWEKAVLLDQQRDIQVSLLPMPLGDGTETHPIMSVNVKVLAEVWTGPNGDWSNNFRQGWGLESPLYQTAIRWTRDRMKSILTRYNPPRVFFTGHSLGGGVASAVAERMAWEFRAEKRLHIRGMTFNSAGVHPKTVNFWPKNTEESVGLGTAPVIDHTVMDEILTTLQSRPHDMPLIGHILRMAGKTLPPGITQIGFRPGKSPGPASSEYGLTFPAEGQDQPRLFPLRKDGQPWQTAVARKDWPAISRLQAVMASSQTALEFAQNLLDDAWATHHKDVIAHGGNWTIYGVWKDILTRYFHNLQPELNDVGTIMKWSAAYHSIQTVEETYFGHI